MPRVNISQNLSAWAPLIFVLLWSTGFVSAKTGLVFAEPATFLMIRFAIATVLFGLIVLWFRVPLPSRPQQWLHLSVVGCLVHGIYLGGVFTAIWLGVNAGVSAMVVGLQPLLTAFIVGPFLGERLTSKQWVGFSLGLLGISLIIAEKFTFSSNDLMALAFCLASLVGISIGTVYQKKFCTEIDLRSGSMIQFLAAAIFMVALSFLYEEQTVDWSSEFVLALVWLCLVLSLGAVTLLMWLIRYGAASKVASLFYLVPPFAAIEAWFMFDEELSVLAFSGMFLCAIGVWLVIKSNATSRIEQ